MTLSFPMRSAAYLLGWGLVFTGSARAADQQLAERAYAVLKQNCYPCHGVDFKVPKFNVLDRDILVKLRGVKKPYLTPGKPEKSKIWSRAGEDEDMPPKGPLSKAQQALLKKWIAAGAPFPRAEKSRPFLSDKDILTAIRNDLRDKVEPEERKFQRYFSLAHLYNNTTVKEEDLRLYRAALAKLVNSLSWEADLVVPKAIDRRETIYRIDLRKLGWDRRGLWRAVLKAYPYALSQDDSKDKTLRRLARTIKDLSRNKVPYLRADWFIASASRPPLYHTLLELPANAAALERKLRVDVLRDFRQDRLARAGLTSSGVSRQNRLVERHPASNGATYYWKSYDFRTNEGRGNLLKYPLGPSSRKHPFPDHTFEHAGGEIIFNLPNGLQGYLLVDHKDNRINEGPSDIVRDLLETSGSPAIVNGLSCMACHKDGIIGGFKDVVRGGDAVSGTAREKVQRLYPGDKKLARLIQKDRRRFLSALEKAIGPFLQVGADKRKAIAEFPEPVGAVARLYVKDLGLEEAARELNFADARELKRLIATNGRLREMGLGPLARGGRIKRQLWGSLTGTYSLFHKAAAELGRGTPVRVR
jgi:serine/threonine-protein kinase